MSKWCRVLETGNPFLAEVGDSEQSELLRQREAKPWQRVHFARCMENFGALVIVDVMTFCRQTTEQHQPGSLILTLHGLHGGVCSLALEHGDCDVFRQRE